MRARIDVVTGAVNTWIVGDDEGVIVIDPGEHAYVICTHGHARHAAGAIDLARRHADAEVALHPGDRLAWRDIHPEAPPDLDLEDGGRFEIAGVTLEVIHAPGHSDGWVCLDSDELGVVFTGDVVTAAGPVAHDGLFTDCGPDQLDRRGHPDPGRRHPDPARARG